MLSKEGLDPFPWGPFGEGLRLGFLLGTTVYIGVFFVGSKFRSFHSLFSLNEYFFTRIFIREGVWYMCAHKGRK